MSLYRRGGWKCGLNHCCVLGLVSLGVSDQNIIKHFVGV